MRWWDPLGWAKREPLVLFILAGSMLFGAHALFAPALGWDDSSRRISVESSDLVRFLQLRSRLFDEKEAQQRFKRMSRAERLTLMDDYVREEVLYREALELGLDSQDYVVRRRLVQSAEYALTTDVRQAEVPSLAALEEWYNGNRQLYSKAPAITFRHVFFRGRDGEQRAAAALDGLVSGRTDPTDTGDRFLYSMTYVEQTPESVAAHFGQAMADALFTGQAKQGWIGPLASPHGFHLVWVEKAERGGQLPFEAVRAHVASDLQEAWRKQEAAQRIAELTGKYRVVLAPELEALR